MASVILNVVGNAIAGPIGGAIGSLIGAAIDSRIAAAFGGGAQSQTVEGARLQDLRVTTSTEGAVIPRIYGKVRTGGNIIWATDFREVVKTTTTSSGGGKGGGGGGSTTTTKQYFYYCSFAVAICEGPIAGIGRIWADGKPFALPGAVYRVHKGTEDQEPDPLIESKMGAGNAPAYRGVAYVVFDNLALEKFGNRIPQLSFEVIRPLQDTGSAEELIRAVNMIPGAGEFIYATEKIMNNIQRDWTWQNYAEVIYSEPENVNSTDPEGRPDFVVSLDTMEAILPNIESVSLVVSWFGTDLRCGNCQIRPKTEYANKSTSPFNRRWIVDGLERPDAPVVSSLPGGGGIAYGGTPADFSVVQAIQEMNSRGLRITFYPFVMMDIAQGNSLPNPYSDNAAGTGQSPYPWRGRITCSPAPGYAGSPDKTSTAATQVAAFFGTAQPSHFTVSGTTVSWNGNPGHWGYRRAILHYAHLCAAAGGVDSFIIGSELRGLTSVRSDEGTYPAVDQLISLAAACRSILGPDTKIGYAADWSEYFGHHPQDGSGDVYFNLDPLWADENIDFIGIDNYMPLSDWRDGFSHADAQAGWRSIYDLEYLQSNIEGGEGYDWYYASPADRDAQERTPITDGDGKPWVFRFKDLRSWWKNQHYNRPGGVEDATPTEWVPESKPIRFTEAGCPAVDKGTNQPNVFFDPKSGESAFPYYSRGARDDFIQRRYIEAIYRYWQDRNETSAVYAGDMVDVGNIAIWTWDARPYPAFPGRYDVWSDAENWRLGHWLSGRLGAGSLGALVREICIRGGMAESQIDVSQLAAAVSGYAIESLESARSSLEPLARFYGFDGIESQGVIRFIPRGGIPTATITGNDLVAARRDEEDIEFTRGQETELPLALKWRLIEAGEEYGGITVEARRITVDTSRIQAENLAICTTAPDADMRCRRALFEAWIGRETARFALPPSRLAIDPADVVLLEHDGRVLEYRVFSVADAEGRGIDAVRSDAVLYGARPGPERLPTVTVPTVYGQPAVAMMNLPLINESVPPHRPFIAVFASPWYGLAAAYRSPTQDGFLLLDTIETPANMGILVSDFYASGAAGSNFDLGNVLVVELSSGTLESVPDIDLFAGANALAVESAPGIWEIVQCGEVELIADGRYKCSRLLRGRLGTEGAMRNPAPAGARVVILNAAVTPISIGESELGIAYNWRIGPGSVEVDDETAYRQISFAGAGTGLRPYAVCQVEQPYKFARVPGDYTIRWKRRTRSPLGDSWNAVEVPLYEDAEAYEVDILDGDAVIRTLSVNAPSALYTEAQQIADWGEPLGPGASLDIIIYQRSVSYGRGAPKQVTLYF